jgi:hypothetical protein
MTNTALRPTHDTHGLVHPLPDGPLDFVADIHGEIDALRLLLERMGYDESDGSHPEGRRLVFLGDLVDRGPDSPEVVKIVRRMIEAGNAQAVMGNHELNILLNKQKKNNGWFMGHEDSKDEKPVDEGDKDAFHEFFASLPLALERADIRAVHANWDDEMIGRARAARNSAELFQTEERAIEALIVEQDITDDVEQKLMKQNLNPVKLLTSGREVRAAKPFKLHPDDDPRHEDRHPWWHDYQGGPFVVFGHYWRKTVVPDKKEMTDRLFKNTSLYAQTSHNTISIDYSVGARPEERKNGVTKHFNGELAALRWPERELVFDHSDETKPLHADQATGAH